MTINQEVLDNHIQGDFSTVMTGKAGNPLPFNTVRLDAITNLKNQESLPVQKQALYTVTIDKFKEAHERVLQLGFDMMVFDEAHKWRPNNDKQAKAIAWERIHTNMAGKPMIYATATPGVDLTQLDYLYGLGEWNKDTFEKYLANLSGIEPRRGGMFAGGSSFISGASIPLTQQFMRELKMKGLYASRDLSRENVKFGIREAQMSPEDIAGYDRYTDFLLRAYKTGVKYAKFNKVAGKKGLGLIKAMMQNAAKRHQVDLKIEKIIPDIKANIAAGKRVFLFTSGLNELDEEAPKGYVRAVINAINEQQVEKVDGQIFADEIPEAIEEKEKLLDEMRELPQQLSIEKYVKQQLGEGFKIGYYTGNTTNAQKIKYLKDWMAGKIDVMLGSDAAKTAISAHDMIGREIVNYYLDIDFEVQRFKQALGRTNRAGEKTSPHILIPSLGAAGEHKFIATVASRMKSLGATSKGQAESGVTNFLSEFDLDGAIAHQAARATYERLNPKYKENFLNEKLWETSPSGERAPKRVAPPDFYVDNFLFDLNFMPYDLGNEIFKELINQYRQIVEASAELAELRAERVEGKQVKETRLYINPENPNDYVDLHEVLDKSGHRFGILTGMLLDKTKELNKYGARHFVKFNTPERIISGKKVLPSEIAPLAKSFGVNMASTLTNDNAFDVIMSGDKVPLIDDLVLYQRKDKMIGIKNAKMADKSALQDAGAGFMPVGSAWVLKEATQDAVRKFIKSYPISQGEIKPPQPQFKSQPSWSYLLKDKQEYEKANQEGQRLIQKYVPQLAQSLVNPAYLMTTQGGKAVGMYYRGRLYVKTGAGLNVYVHEMGHAVFDMFLTRQEKDALLAEGRKIYGPNANVEERIMLDFEKYAQDERFIPAGGIWEAVQSFFRRLANRVSSFVNSDPGAIKGFYNAVLGGEYAYAQPRKEFAAAEPAYKEEEPFKGPAIYDPAIASIAKAYKEVVSLLAPRMLVPRESLDMIMRMKGERDKLEFVLERKLIKLERAFDRMKREDQVDFIDRIKTGTPQKTEGLQKVADMMREVEDKYWAQAKQYKPSLAYKQNHYRVMWRVIPGSPEARGFRGNFRRPFEGSKGWAKKSTLEDMSEGLKAGGVPYSYNPITMWRNSVMDMHKYITAQRMWRALKGMGMVKFVRFGQRVDPGMVKVEDRISTVYLPVEATPPGSDSSFPAMAHLGNYYVEEGSGRILNNFLGRDYIRESTFGGSLLAFKNFTTGVELAISPFHAAYTTLMASSSNIGLGLQKIANRGIIQRDPKAFLEGMRDILHGFPLAGAARYLDTGNKAFNYVTREDFVASRAGQDFLKAFPDAEALMNDLFTGGGRLAQHQDYKINAIKAFQQGIRDFGDARRSFLVAQENKDAALMQKYALEMANNAWAEVIHALPSANQAIMSPLFEHYIPRLKVGGFLLEFSNELVARRDQLESGRLTRAQLAREVWDSVERRFGEMNFDNLFWNRNFKTALQLTFRSVTWKLGALQNIGGAGTGTLQELAHAVQDKELPKLNRNLAMLLGLAIMVTLFSAIMQKFWTGKNIGERDDGKEDFGLLLKDIMDPRYDAKGNRLFLNTHLKDWAHLFHSPGGFLANSTSGFIGRAIEDWQNKDFFNAQIHNPRDPVYKQAWDLLVHLIPAPFMLSNQYHLKGENAPLSAKILTGTGFTTPAPGYVNQTPTYQLALQIMHDKPYSQVTKTKAQEDKYKFMTTLRDNYATTHDSAPLQAAERAGQITFKQMIDIKKKSTMTPLERIASSHQMNFDDIAQLMNKSIADKSVDEQNTLWPILREKYFSTMEHVGFNAGGQERRNDLMDVYNDIKKKIGK